MKRAFKNKALQFHPDRNPHGAEMFKKINSSYEQLCIHYKKGGGVDKRSIYEDEGAPRYQARPGGPPATTTSAPLFTEEELFGSKASTGSEFGMFGSSARGGPSANMAGGYRRGFRQRSAGETRGGTYSSFDPRHEASEEKRSAAHGGRTAQSGYSAFTSPEDMSAFESQMKHFEEMERRKRDLFKDGATQQSSTATGTPPRYGRRSESSMGNSPSHKGPSHTTRSSVEEEFTGPNAGPLPPQRPGMYANRRSSSQSANTGNRRHTSSADEEDPKARSQNVMSQRLMEEEWEFERQVQESNRRAQEAEEETSRKIRRAQREQETQEEWERMQAEMEEEKLSRAAAERTEELRRQLERRDRQAKWREEEEDISHLRGDGGRRMSATTSDIAEEDIASYRSGPGMAASSVVDKEMVITAKARRATKVEKICHMLPHDGAVERLSLPELFILSEALNRLSAGTMSLLQGRLTRSTHCLVCHVSKADPRTEGVYRCDHGCLCFTCSFTCAICPLCGAERRAPIED